MTAARSNRRVAGGQSEKFTAVILAGGRGRRMGRRKASLRLGGESMIERIVGRLRPAFDEIIVVSAPQKERGFRASARGTKIVYDQTAFEGPMAALARGLCAATHDTVFLCGCDLPMVNADVALALCRWCAGREAAIPLVGGRVQPLYAAYGRAAHARIARLMRRGERRMTALARALDARIVYRREIERIDPRLSSFLNVNTPADYARARSLVRCAGGDAHA